MSYPLEKNCVYVTGFDKDIDRKFLVAEFRRFGSVNKCYLDPTGEFAKIYFSDKLSAEAAISELRISSSWQVTLYNSLQQTNSTHNMSYYDDYEDDDFYLNANYCNIHGQPLEVLEANSGDLYVSLKDIKKTGFALFRRDTFDCTLMDRRQIGKEFELHLLSEAKNYILKNRAACIDEELILKTIERCKNKLLGDGPSNTRNSFGAGRSVEQFSGNLTVTSNVQDPGIDDLPMVPQGIPSRPPKLLPENFVPTHTQRNETSKGFNDNSRGFRKNQQESQRGREVGDNARYNGFSASSSNSNNGNSPENKTNFRQGGFEQGNKTQRNQREVKEEIAKINFEDGSIYEVLVCFKEKENICWVQDKKYANELEEVIIQVNELIENLEPLNPVLGQLVAAEYEGTWNRGRVVAVDPVIVHFLDYGNKSGVDSVKPLPDSLKTIPALAARITICNQQELKEEMDLKIRIKRKYDDGTCLVSLLNRDNRRRDEDAASKSDDSLSMSKESLEPPVQRPPTPKEVPHEPVQKIYTAIPKPMSELRGGDKVMLVDVDSNKFLVKTKECALKSRTITDYIKSLDKSALILTKVKVGQLVLCSKDGFVGLFRAVVVKRDNELIASVKYVDFPGEAELSIKSLRNVDDFLASEPSSVLMTPEFKRLEDMNEEAAEFILTACQNKVKFTVVSNEGNFDLQADDGTLLSQKVRSFTSPKLVPEKAPRVSPLPTKEKVETETVAKKVPATETKVIYDEMDWIKMEPGKHTLMCYSLQDFDDITFLSSSEEVINYLELITGVNPTDQDPYEPEVSEMCLVSYKGPEDDEATWYRAVVLAAEDEGYTVNFVDFGNMELVQSKDIRKFPSHLKDIPILGVGCECVGLPNKPQILERLKELMPEGTQVEVVIKGLEDLKYQIELPDLYKQLKSEKLF